MGSDGYRVYHKAKVEKAVSDRRASLDEENEIKPTMRAVVQKEFERGATPAPVCFPADDTAVGDLPRLTLVVLDPGLEWTGKGALRTQLADWTRKRRSANRLYPGALAWCVRRPGRDLRDKAELWLAWKRVHREVSEGLLGAEYDRADKEEIGVKVADAEEAAKDEVWAGYRAEGRRTAQRIRRRRLPGPQLAAGLPAELWNKLGTKLIPKLSDKYSSA